MRPVGSTTTSSRRSSRVTTAARNGRARNAPARTAHLALCERPRRRPPAAAGRGSRSALARRRPGTQSAIGWSPKTTPREATHHHVQGHPKTERQLNAVLLAQLRTRPLKNRTYEPVRFQVRFSLPTSSRPTHTVAFILKSDTGRLIRCGGWGRLGGCSTQWCLPPAGCRWAAGPRASRPGSTSTRKTSVEVDGAKLRPKDAVSSSVRACVRRYAQNVLAQDGGIEI